MFSLINNMKCVKNGERTLYNASVKYLKNIGKLEISYFKKIIEEGVIMAGSPTKRGEGSLENKEKHLSAGRIRAGSRVRELIILNNLRYHWILTYKEASEGENVDFVKADINRFIKRLRRNKKGERLPYVAVLEIQEERYIKHGERVWHIHLAIDTYVKHDEIECYWGKGYVYVQKHTGNLQLVAGYLAKYLKKDMAKYDIPEKKRYLCSQGLIRANRRKICLSKEQLELIAKLTNAKVEYDGFEWYQLDVDKLNMFAEALGYEKIKIID